MDPPAWGPPASISRVISEAYAMDALGPLGTHSTLATAIVTDSPAQGLSMQGGGNEGAIGEVVSPEAPTTLGSMLVTSTAVEPFM
jgi:hypothetical protein